MPIFSEEALKAAINATLNTAIVVPEGKDGCFVMTYSPGGFHTAVAMKVNDVWAVQGGINFIPTTHTFDYGISVKASWP